MVWHRRRRCLSECLPHHQKELDRDLCNVGTRHVEEPSALAFPLRIMVSSVVHEGSYWETRGDRPICSTTACARAELKAAESTARPTGRVGRRYNWLPVHSNRFCEKSARPHQANSYETTALAREGQDTSVGDHPTGTQRLRALIGSRVRPRRTYKDHESPFLGPPKPLIHLFCPLNSRLRCQTSSRSST